MDKKETCEWWDEDGVWASSCGAAFGFDDGGPEDNGFNFCYKCGLPIDVDSTPSADGQALPASAGSVVAAFEFDQCHAAPQRVEVRENESGYVSVVLTGEKDMHLFGATLDQWGTWYDANETVCVAQEWGARSFIGALIAALEKFRERSEGGTLRQHMN